MTPMLMISPSARRRPLIAVSVPQRGDLLTFAAISFALRRAGAKPMQIDAAAAASLQDVQGLVLGGGVDIHPDRFGAVSKTGYAYDTARDALELALVRRAQVLGLATLGICRGMQLMNVAAGGTLHLDLRAQFGAALYPRHWLRQTYFRRRIEIEPGSRLHAALERERLKVNSVHGQGVDKLGEGLIVSARDENGLAQAIEKPDAPFWIGVQFHPEFMPLSTGAHRLFSALVEAARRCAAAERIPRELDVDSAQDAQI